MKDLIALVEVVSKNKIKEIEVIGNTSSNSITNLQKLYNGIYEGKIRSDQDIIDVFFPSSKNASLYCSRMKSKLKERLINTLFFIDLNQSIFNDYNRAFFSSYKMATATRILLSRGARVAAAPIAEKALQLALQFDLTDVALLMAKDLRNHYGAMHGAKEKYEEMNQIVEDQLQVLAAELEAEKYMTSLMMNVVKIKATKPEYAAKAKEFVEQLEKFRYKVKSYRFNYLYFLVKVTRFELAGDYKNMLPICQEALAYFQSKKEIVPNTVLYSFNIRYLICLIQLKDYSEAKALIPQCLSLTPEGTHNWFLVHNYHMMLCFHSASFQEAYEIGQKIFTHTKLKNQDERTIEFWKIHEAYLFYMITIHKIIPDQNNPLKKFRLNKFINEVPMYRKDKTGANITIIVLQILFLLVDKKYDAIIDRIESLKTYTQRYLRNDDTFRSNCFIRMLVVMAESSFNKKATVRKAEKYLYKLREKPNNIAEQSAEIEIVPYEMLWEFVLESLDEKWH